MILPETLHPSMTRSGYDYPNGVPLRNSQPGDFPKTTDGLWLPTLEVARVNLAITSRHFAGIVATLGNKAHQATRNANRAVKSARFDTDSGCWHAETPDHTADLWTIAYHEMGRVLNPPESKGRLSICHSASCLNTRHFDFTYGVARRTELYEPTDALYSVLPDGRIKTAWGDILPSVADSIAKFLDFRLKCPPFAKETTSPLTANGISKITIHPTSGCWKVRSYYTAPDGTDNYGRLRLRSHLQKGGNRSGSQMLAHRVLWIVTGHTEKPGLELNHLCGYRACCNPDHIQQVTKEQNNKHAWRMQHAIRRLGLAQRVVV